MYLECAIISIYIFCLSTVGRIESEVEDSLDKSIHKIDRHSCRLAKYSVFTNVAKIYIILKLQLKMRSNLCKTKNKLHDFSSIPILISIL